MKTRKLSFRIGALFCGALVLGACEGENLFDNQSNPFVEPRVEVFAPDFAMAGDTVIVSLTATAALNVQRIAVVLRGAVNKDTLISTGQVRTASAAVKIGVPSLPPSNIVLIAAQAADQSGRLSRQVADTIQVFTGSN
jgi:hypothetical protein